MKYPRKSKRNQFGLVLLGFLTALGSSSLVLFSHNGFNESRKQQHIWLANKIRQSEVNNDQKSVDDTKSVKLHDQNGSTLNFASSFIRLNNKQIYNEVKNVLETKSLLQIYNQYAIVEQSIELNEMFNHLSMVDTNDISKGIVVSNLFGKALWFDVDLIKNRLKPDFKSVNVPINSTSVGANFNTKNSDGKETNESVVVSAEAKNDASNSYFLDITVTSINSLNKYHVDQIKTSAREFNAIEVVSSYAIGTNLFLGLNFFNIDQMTHTKKAIGSEMIFLKDGKFVPGGPSFFLHFTLTTMIFDAEHRSIYAQYRDIKDKSLRIWGFGTDKPDAFAQITAQVNHEFSSMTYVPGVGIAALNASKTTVELFKFAEQSLTTAPNFTAAVSFQNNLMRNGELKISDLVFNPSTKTFNLFYAPDNFTDGFIQWNLNATVDDDTWYTNFVPIHIDYEKLIKIKNQNSWLNVFASVYARQEISKVFADFLVLDGYYQSLRKQNQLNKDDSFVINYVVNDNLGEIKLTITGKPQAIENSITLLDTSVHGYRKVLPSNIVTNINRSSDLFNKTPSEVQALLSDPLTTTQTKLEIFDLFGFAKEYAQLPFDVKINDTSVLGNINFQITFNTVHTTAKNSLISNHSEIVTNQNDLTNSQASTLNFSDAFQISIERWFIPVVTILAIIVFAGIILGLWFSYGKRLYKRYVTGNQQRIMEEYHALEEAAIENEAFLKTSDLQLPVTISKSVPKTAFGARFREEIPYVKKRQDQQIDRRLANSHNIDNFHTQLAKKRIHWQASLSLTKPVIKS